jgi:hypothetical protein
MIRALSIIIAWIIDSFFDEKLEIKIIKPDPRAFWYNPLNESIDLRIFNINNKVLIVNF